MGLTLFKNLVLKINGTYLEQLKYITIHIRFKYLFHFKIQNNYIRRGRFMGFPLYNEGPRSSASYQRRIYGHLTKTLTYGLCF